MMQFVQWFMKKPTDTSIRIGRIVLGLVLIGLSSYNLLYLGKALETEFFWISASEGFITGVKYFLSLVGFFPLIVGLTGICVMKAKYMRISQIILGIILIYLSTKIQEGPDLDFDIVLFFVGFYPLFMGITGKCITKNCQRFAEKIQKIRV